MLTWARRKFTKWYIKKRYGIHPDFSFRCPLYVKPLLFLLSPSVYFYYRESGNQFLDGFLQGLSQGEVKK